MKEHAMARVNGIFSDGLFVPPLVIPSLVAVAVLVIAAYKSSRTDQCLQYLVISMTSLIV